MIDKRRFLFTLVASALLPSVHAGSPPPRDHPALGQGVDLAREPWNRHDPAAIRVEWDGRKLGYVPRSNSTDLANLMDQGIEADATIIALSLSADPWERAELDIAIEVRVNPPGESHPAW